MADRINWRRILSWVMFFDLLMVIGLLTILMILLASSNTTQGYAACLVVAVINGTMMFIIFGEGAKL